MNRQRESEIVERIGDVFLGVVNEFEVFMPYARNISYASQALDHEIAGNPEFAKFLQVCFPYPKIL